MSLTLAFMGTPDFAVPTLAGLLAAGHKVGAVYSQPPRKAGRGMAAQKSPVHQFAEAQGLIVRTPLSLKDETESRAFAALNLDAAVVVAYGLILPRPILAAPRLGCFNLHASLLPRWRGAAPIQRAIMAGDQETGVMVMQMEEGLDTGPILLAERIAIGPETTAGGLHDELARLGAALMVRALGELERGTLTATPQAAEGVTYASKIAKAEARIDWTRSAAELDAHIRGLSPAPGAFFELARDGKPVRVKVLRAKSVTGSGAANGVPGQVLDDQLTIACGQGALQLLDLQRAGKAPMSALDFLRGLPIAKGERVG